MQAVAVDVLRKHISEPTKAEIREAIRKDPEGWSIPYHFGFGMSVRNALRKMIRDTQLPPVPYPDGNSYQNWDDYYVEVLEHAV